MDAEEQPFRIRSKRKGKKVALDLELRYIIAFHASADKYAQQRGAVMTFVRCRSNS